MKIKIKPSIYQQIHQSLKNNGDTLKGSQLDLVRKQVGTLQFAAGAQDGIYLYHMGTDYAEDAVNQIVELIKKLSYHKTRWTIRKLENWLTDIRIITLADPLLTAIVERIDEFNSKGLYQLSDYLVTASKTTELVKCGIMLASLIELTLENELLQKIREVGYYDEFTLFSLITLEANNSSNQMCFEYAKSSLGWGKVHAITRLEVTNNETRDWIIQQGCLTGDLAMYLGRICAEKGQLYHYLQKEMITEAEFNGITAIFSCLLDEGPVLGISLLPEAEEQLALYLKHSQTHQASIDVLTKAYEWLKIQEDLEDKQVIMEFQLALKNLA
ncbi:hypothetical protein ACWOFR_10190 [Carnobacterium gallinarum]|uniref:hypothetical protein n=1 Tax=Carnobacterium gallinarum TaxID=2749 RepID=UPI00055176EB|nr:hypothetical protein [Carnobacterium gallinarum]